MRIFAVLAVASSLSFVACASSPAQTPTTVAAASTAIGSWTSDASGFDTTSWWYDTGREVVVFDAQFTEGHARTLIDTIHKRTTSKITWLVITHPNPDKFNGAAAFQAIGAKVIASKATADALPGVHAYKKGYFVSSAKMFTEETYPRLPSVDVTFAGNTSIADGAVELRELRHAGISTTQTIGVIPAATSVVVGDLVHPKTHAWLEGGIRDGKPTPDVASWIAALDELKTLKGWTVLPGRGPRNLVEEAVPAQQDYLRRLQAIVHDYVVALPDRTALAGASAAVHWKNVRSLAESAFPDYQLPYLIEYGVYGLALSVTD